MSLSSYKVAVIHDWLVTYAGAERVLENILKVFPQADLFSTIDFVPESQRAFLQGKNVKTTFIQKLPFAKKKYPYYLPFMPFALEQFDLRGYDIILSSHHAVAKSVISGPDQLNICFCHTPIRYAWDLQGQYLKEAGLDKGLKSFLARLMLHNARYADLRSVNNVDHFIAVSEFISRRIRKIWRRDSTVIHPPVDVSLFSYCDSKEDFYLTASRMVPYKKIDLIVEAFSHLKDKKLVVIGDGPEWKKIQAKAGSNVELMGYQSNTVLVEKMQKAKAFIFAAEEDFGIVPIEAMACGTPVIALAKGATAETVKNRITGIHFKEQTVDSLLESILEFERIHTQFDRQEIRRWAESFSSETFRSNIKLFVEEKATEFFKFRQ